MNRTSFRILAFGIVLCLVAVPQTSFAAKGVKKTDPANARRTISGVVTSISPDKTGYGTFQVRTASSHKKVGVNNAGANGNNGAINHQKLTVTSATRVEHHNGSAVSHVNIAALKTGQHVRVQATGQQAQSVHIITHNKYRGSYVRHRPSSYRPHHSYHTNHALHVNHPHHASHRRR